LKGAAGLQKVMSGDPTQLEAYAAQRIVTAEGAELFGRVLMHIRWLTTIDEPALLPVAEVRGRPIVQGI